MAVFEAEKTAMVIAAKQKGHRREFREARAGSTAPPRRDGALAHPPSLCRERVISQ